MIASNDDDADGDGDGDVDGDVEYVDDDGGRKENKSAPTQCGPEAG